MMWLKEYCQRCGCEIPRDTGGCTVCRNTMTLTHDTRPVVARMSVAEVEELAALRDVAEKARGRLRHGHNDTCGHALSPEYACSCGHDGVGEALERLDRLRGGK